MLAVDSILARRGKGCTRELWSTVDITVDGELISKRITSWDELMRVRDADILLDEVVSLASGRETMGLPHDVLAWMGSLRHINSTVTWTSPGWNDADVKLRQVTQVLFQVIPFIRGKRRDGELWRPTLVAKIRTFDMTGRSGEGPTDKERSRAVAFVRLRGCKAFGTYDTFAQVSQLSEYGKPCPVCGGKIVRPVCKNPQEHARMGKGGTVPVSR